MADHCTCEIERIDGAFCGAMYSSYIYMERENWTTLLEEPFVVLGTVILYERGRELEVSCVVLV